MAEVPTKEELKDLLLSEDPFQAMEILLSGWVPLEHAVLAGNLHVSAERLREAMGRRGERGEGELPPEHKELDKAVADAIESADIAFDAALNAAWQLVYLSHNCDCPACRLRHQRANAEHQ
jgi:hypothetical protein